jgi:hypothetical protein
MGKIMKNYRKSKSAVVGFTALVFTLISGFATPALAVPIVFSLGFGGSVSFGGSGTPLVTTDGAVTFVTNGTINLSITGGDLDFTTGNYTGGTSSGTSYTNSYAAGGSLSISGGINGQPIVPLLSGSFSDISTFNCCNGIAASFNGLLDVSYVDSNLADALGFNLPPTGGAIGQVQIFFGSVPAGPGLAFTTGVQGGGSVNVTDTAKVPEPASLLFLGLGLVGLGLFGRARVKRLQADRALNKF